MTQQPDEQEPPELPDEYLVRFTATTLGRMRSRVLGTPSEAPPVVTVMGMAVSDYLLPALAELRWTESHLIDLPGLAGSGPPPTPSTCPAMPRRSRTGSTRPTCARLS